MQGDDKLSTLQLMQAKKMEIEQAFKIDQTKRIGFFSIENVRIVYSNPNSFVTQSKYAKSSNDFRDVAVKWFKWKNGSQTIDKSLNETITCQILRDDQEKDLIQMGPRKSFIAEYIGFLYDENLDYSFYGAIVSKWYPRGDLNAFCKKMKANGTTNVDQLISFSQQIASGNNLNMLEILKIYNFHLSIIKL